MRVELRDKRTADSPIHPRSLCRFKAYRPCQEEEGQRSASSQRLRLHLSYGLLPLRQYWSCSTGHAKKRKGNALLLLRGFDFISHTVSSLSDNIGHALQIHSYHCHQRPGYR
ncbi:hypothetical protein LINGRAHAP2_LOCUS33159 [Linum grandiflorum]